MTYHSNGSGGVSGPRKALGGCAIVAAAFFLLLAIFGIVLVVLIAKSGS